MHICIELFPWLIPYNLNPKPFRSARVQHADTLMQSDSETLHITAVLFGIQMRNNSRLLFKKKKKKLKKHDFFLAREEDAVTV